MNENTHAVLDDSFVYYHQTGRTFRQRVHDLTTAGQLLALAESLNVKSLWIAPDTALSRQAGQEGWLTAPDGWTLNKNASSILIPHEGRALVAFAGWRESGRTRVIMFSRPGDSWGLAEAETPLMLLAALDYIAEALEVAPCWSTGYIGQQLMRRSNGGARHPWTVPVNLSPYPALLEAMQGGYPRPFTWRRPLSPAEANRPYLIAIDKNSAYPAACTGVELGIGEPGYLPGRRIDLTAPGVGCYRLANATPPPALPCPLPTIDEIAPNGWLWTPTLHALRKLGYSIELAEGYHWRQSKTVLRPWAEQVYQARAKVRSNEGGAYPYEQACELAQQAIKGVANVGLQWLDLLDKDFSTENPYHRPDWYALVKDRARAAQLEQVAYFAGKYHLFPVMIHVDALYYAAEAPCIDEAMPGVLARSTRLGGYKDALGGALPLAPFVDLFAQEDIHPLAIQRALHDHAAKAEEA